MTGNIIIKVGNTIKFKDEKWQKSSWASKMHISKSEWKVQRKVRKMYVKGKKIVRDVWNSNFAATIIHFLGNQMPKCQNILGFYHKEIKNTQTLCEIF